MHIMILAQKVLHIFVHNVALLYKMPKSEKGQFKYLQNFAKIQSGHLHLLYAKYLDPSSRCSPDILFTMSFMAQMTKYEKGNNSVKYSQNFMVIYFPTCNCMHDIMILAQTVLQIICS